MTKYLALCELVEGGEWIALKRHFEAMKKKNPSNHFSIIAFTKNHIPDLRFFDFKTILNYSTAKKPFSYAKKSIKDFTKIRKSIERHLSKDKPDFILSVDYISCLAAMSVKPRDVKLIFLFHGIRSALLRDIKEINYWQIVIKTLERFCWVFADAVTVPSQKAKEYLLKWTYLLPKRPNIFLIPNIVPNHFFKLWSAKEKINFRRKIKITDRDKILLYAGRIGKYKGVINLITAFNSIVNIFPNIKLLIVHPTSSKEKEIENKIKRLVNNFNLEHQIIFYKDPNQDVLSKIYQISDLSILPSEVENAPLSIIESLASGTPVIGTNVGNIWELQKKILPRLILNNNSPEEISNKVITFFKSNLKTNVISQKCRVMAGKFSEENAVKEFEKMIDKFESGKKSNF